MNVAELKPLVNDLNNQENFFYSPSSLVAIFNAATVIREEKKIIQLKGIFKKTGTANYGGNFYNKLKDEAGENSITLITPSLIHNSLNDNKTIEFNGFITRRVDKSGRIELLINFIELLAQRVNTFSEEETKKILLINKKVEAGFKDLDSFIKESVYHNKKLTVKIIMGRSAIIDTDIKDAMEAAVSLYNIEFHRVSLSSPAEIIKKIKEIDNDETDVLCVARGGGENLSVFDDAALCEAILNCKTIVASAIGHAQDVTLFEKLSDKKFITPTHFGNYLREIYNSAVAEMENSKAKLIKDITDNLNANYLQQIKNLEDQIKASKELHEKSVSELNINHEGQLKVLQEQISSLSTISKKSKDDSEAIVQELIRMHNQKLLDANELNLQKTEVLQKQIETLKNQQRQSELLLQQSNSLVENYKNNSTAVWVYAVIALIAGLILGALIFSGK
ncbi:MAG: hypothetical protein JSR00_03010 [Bacteroidetes bacterium]|nr:hypothetical protein [Bacteroidota bacterium]